MTAVEWLLKILEAQKEDAFNYDEWLITFNYALEMEKEQFEKLKDFETWKEWKDI